MGGLSNAIEPPAGGAFQIHIPLEWLHFKMKMRTYQLLSCPLCVFAHKCVCVCVRANVCNDYVSMPAGMYVMMHV